MKIKGNEIRIDHDDSVIDIVDALNAVLAGTGIRLEDDGKEHDGFVIYQVVMEKKPEQK